MVTKSRPYIEVNPNMDLVEIEESMSNGIDVLCFGVEESLNRLLKTNLISDDKQVVIELLDVVEKLKEVIDDGYSNSSSDYVERLLW